MRKRIVLFGAALSLIGTAAMAQMGGGMSPEASAQMEKWRKFREDHKYTNQLTRMTRNIAELEETPDAALSPQQAKQVLKIMKPLRAKNKLTQEEAKETLKALKKVLNTKQLTAISRMRPRQFGQGGGRQMGMGGGPGMGGGGMMGKGPGMGGGGMMGKGPGMGGGMRAGAGGRRANFDPARMKNYNPYSSKVDKDNPMSSRNKQRQDQFFAAMQKKSSGR